jgi:hypothetical protein
MIAALTGDFGFSPRELMSDIRIGRTIRTRTTPDGIRIARSSPISDRSRMNKEGRLRRPITIPVSLVPKFVSVMSWLITMPAKTSQTAGLAKAMKVDSNDATSKRGSANSRHSAVISIDTGSSVQQTADTSANAITIRA